MSDSQSNRGFNKTFNAEEIARLKKLIEEGCQVQYEIDALKDGLNDTIKAIAEEMDVKPGILKKAISVAHKANFDEVYTDFDALETILDVVGKKL
jgi:hypothetical protein